MEPEEITVPTAATDERPWHLAREGYVPGVLDEEVAWMVVIDRLGSGKQMIVGGSYGAGARADAWRVCELLNDEEEFGAGDAGILRRAAEILSQRAKQAEGDPWEEAPVDDVDLYAVAEAVRTESEQA